MESAHQLVSSLLSRCKSLKAAQLIHQKIIIHGLLLPPHNSKTLIDLYFSSSLFSSAANLASSISLFNHLISSFTKHHMFLHALRLYHTLLLRSPHVGPDSYTYPSVLKACGALGRLRLGAMIHTHLAKTGLMSDIVVASSVVGMYAKCNEFGYAIQVFDEMRDRDVASWNAVISCYYQDGQPGMALKMYDEMKSFGFRPNAVTMTTVVSSCARLLDLERGREVHKEMIEGGVELDSFVSSALVDMYGKCGHLDMAKEVFGRVLRKSVVAWNSMIAAYCVSGDSKSCVDLLRRMIHEGTSPSLITFSSILMACSRSVQLQHGKFMHGYMIRNFVEADIHIYSLLVDLYFVCGSVSSAKNVFSNMPKANVVSWNVMVSGYVKVGNYFGALGMYDEMKKAGVRPNAITVTSILSVCSHLTALEKGKDVHRTVVDSELESNEIVMGSLLDMYAKCGAVDEALDVFNKLPSRDLVSWTSMIAAYGSHGQATEALKLFNEMQQSNAKPDGVTLLAVLSACSHAGLVDEGSHYFNEMISKYGIEPRIEHYSCLIDLLGRAGRLNEAYQIIKRTPQIDNVHLLSTLLSACLLHRNQDLGISIAKLLIEMNPDDHSTYIMLSHSLASGNKWNEVRKVRLKMKELGLRKTPACSWIEINNRIQSFFVQDKSHPESETIYQCLKLLKTHMEGHAQFSQWGSAILYTN